MPSNSQCGAHVCVHYVPTTADAPPSPEMVKAALATLAQLQAKMLEQSQWVGANFANVIDEVKERLEGTPAPINMPFHSRSRSLF